MEDADDDTVAEEALDGSQEEERLEQQYGQGYQNENLYLVIRIHPFVSLMMQDKLPPPW